MEIIVSSKNPGDLSAIAHLPSTMTKMLPSDKVDQYVAAQTLLGYNCHRFGYQNSFRGQKSVEPFLAVA